MSGRLRVLAITADLRTGGAERHLATVLPALDRERFEPHVCCIGGRGALAGDLEKSGVPVADLEAGDGDRSVPAAFRRLRSHVSRLRPDVVMTHGLRANVLGRVAARSAGTRVIAGWKHNCGHVGHHGALDRASERLLGPITSRYFGVAFGQVPYLVGYLGIDPKKLRIIHNGVDTRAYAAGRPRDPALMQELGIGEQTAVAATVAVLRSEKDHPTILRAMAEVGKRLPDARLLLIGDGPDRPVLEALARRLGIERSVVFMGNRGDIASCLSVADVLVLASVTVECFPYAALEAMAMGKPVVSTAVGGLPEMIEDGVTGHLVAPRDPRALAGRMLEVLLRDDRGAALGAAARRRVETRFDLGTSVRMIERELVAAANGAHP
jgi:glycosyltransferase involved in cell wall biosynthesis